MQQSSGISMVEAGNAWQLFAEDLLAALEPALQVTDELVDLLYRDLVVQATHRLPRLVGLVVVMAGLVVVLTCLLRKQAVEIFLAIVVLGEPKLRAPGEWMRIRWVAALPAKAQ